MRDIRASIDIGSNSILLLIIEFSNEIAVLENKSNVTGLGRDLDLNKKFIDEAMDDSYSVLADYAKLCQKHGIALKNVVMTATEASRVASNASIFYERIESEIGLKVQIITGLGEAFYSTQGVLFDKSISENEIVIMDIGGASTEFIKVSTQKNKILKSFSMPVGAVRVNSWRESNQHVDNLNDILADYAEELKSLATTKLYCVAGTMTSVGNMYLGEKKFNEQEVNGLYLKSKDVINLKNKYHDFSGDDYLKEFPFLGKRSQTIESGLWLASNIFEYLEIVDLYVSTYGLRYGTILSNKIAKEYVV